MEATGAPQVYSNRVSRRANADDLRPPAAGDSRGLNQAASMNRRRSVGTRSILIQDLFPSGHFPGLKQTDEFPSHSAVCCLCVN